MIKVSNLKKTFGTKAAVDGVSFGVAKGEILGFLGPNGAGKSTTMRIVTGFLPPTSGEARVGDFDVEEHPVEAKRLVGYLPENAPCYSDMTVTGFLRFCGEARGLRGGALRDAVDRAISTCFLGPVVHQSIDTLSKGYKHRTCLAQAILHDPPVLVLDEPTAGVDPVGSREIRDLILSLKARGKTILLCSHLLSQVQEICDRVGILARGSLVREGRVDDLLSMRDREEIVVEETSPEKIAALRKAAEGLGLKIVSSGRPQTTLENLFLEAIEPGQSADSGTGVSPR